MENREAEKGQKRGNGRDDAREANRRRPARTGAAARREKARDGFGLLKLVVRFYTKLNLAFLVPQTQWETFCAMRARWERKRSPHTTSLVRHIRPAERRWVMLASLLR
jgi:hypothetical protein